MTDELYAALIAERYGAPILPDPGREPVRAELQRRHARVAGEALDHAPQNYRRGWRPVDDPVDYRGASVDDPVVPCGQRVERIPYTATDVGFQQCPRLNSK